MNSYLVAVIGMLILIVIVMSWVMRSQAAHMNKLNEQIGTLNASLATCQRINSENTAEITKLGTAIKAAEGEAKIAQEKVKTITANFNKRVLEITNAKDNGAIPGVLQRTIDGLRSRTAGGEDRESSINNPIFSPVMLLASPSGAEVEWRRWDNSLHYNGAAVVGRV